ncbi:UNVERIFIED_CONTAM: hypothetical protein PYX00_004175 [Menopon gallinae]|uniref:Solute carrier family 23 member 1 n=1 Tax=Menopon gallinae TaxID=328185 RepID=A0AAW2I2S0_9NEOP
MEAEDSRNGGKAEEQEVAMPTDDTGPINEMGSLPLIYAVEDRPSWGLSFLLGLQHYLTMVGGIISLPFILSPFLCILNDDPTRGYLISTIFMVSGVATILQTVFGVRLPIVQGTSLTYLTCSLAILQLPQWKCPTPGDLYAMGHVNRTEEWQMRMREIQGAIIGASVLEVIIGYCGLIGILLKFITPLTIAPTITLVGLSLVTHGAELSSGNWYISGLTVILVTVFSQYLRRFVTKVPVYTLTKGWFIAKFKGFQLLPVLITTVIVYVVCAILTRYDVLPPEDPGRIDQRTNILVNADWFIFPYPFQWGWPTFTFSSIMAMFAAVIAGIVESVGDYYACAKICGKPPPPKMAINRGIGVEGLGCIFAGTMGIGTGVTSLSENIGAIGVTRVGSRIVVQCGAIIMIFLSFSGKVGAMFATIPSPVIGGFLCVMFSMVTAVGLSNLQYIDMGSPRNLFVLGVSVFFGVALPGWLKDNPHAIETGVLSVDQLITVLLSTPMFVGGFLGFFLDNTIPGSDQERGLQAWRGKEKREALMETDL